VRFEVDAPAELELTECNCSICGRSGTMLAFIPAAQFTLKSGEDALTDYQFGKKHIHHLFCATCGIKSFYVPRSHPDGLSVNARCLDAGTATGTRVSPFDGDHWEASTATLPPLERRGS